MSRSVIKNKIIWLKDYNHDLELTIKVLHQSVSVSWLKMQQKIMKTVTSLLRYCLAQLQLYILEEDIQVPYIVMCFTETGHEK